MNTKGQLIITDLLVYVIVLTVIMGIIIYSISILNDKEVSDINSIELNNLLDDSVSMLIKQSGTPSNWEKDISNTKSIGLKSVNDSKISYDKLIKLKDNDYLLDDYFPSGVVYSLVLYPKSNPQNIINIAGNQSTFINRKQVFSKEVPIIIDYAYNITALNNNKSLNPCQYNHNNDEWSCWMITINDEYLSKGKYYLLTNKHTQYVLSNTYSQNITGTCEDNIDITNQLKQLQIHKNQSITIHLKIKNSQNYIVYDSNDRNNYLNTVYRPEVYILKMQVAK